MHQLHEQLTVRVCAALRCAALRCAALRCAALRCAALRCAALRCTTYIPCEITYSKSICMCICVYLYITLHYIVYISLVIITI